VALLTGLLMGGTAQAAGSAEREKLLSDPGVYATFAAFQMKHEWWNLTGEARVIAVSEVKGLIEQFSSKIVVETYLLRGLSDHADFMFRLHARSLSDNQQFLVSLLGTRFGRYLEAATYLQGVTKPAAYASEFSDELKAALKGQAEVGARPYVIVIPIRKDADWWALDQTARQALIQEHTQAALAYTPVVKRKLYHSTGLDDFDFITYFETDRLEEFQRLMRALEQVKEYRHVRRIGHPTLLGTLSPLDDILESFAR